ncbi:MBL fold metallo-hydrolase RNA specificity domain-containing protein [Humisphaera borealis]|uniref:MBL fold metallo-hydrolase n=1 Tax=Humisphaera borealis TaxID=2807512 RepID=A0A7M2WX30_9BACT|nr:MBL fold metallo-hydrolase [Humisphaera borealis]QOV90088.1 MBL fold metallo-hydrolase [Humisphaera borealis]
MRIQFCGADRTVTGSSHLIEVNGLRIFLDMGMFQGPRDEARRMNEYLPADVKTADAIILSHAHFDHSGKLPVAVRAGFSGPIYCTPPTAEVTNVILQDAARIQVEDAEHLNQRVRRLDEPKIEPLFAPDDLAAVFRLVKRVRYGQKTDLGNNVSFTFHDAGHILGSAYVIVEWTEPATGTPRKLLFTADIGRYNTPIINDPTPLPGPVDLVISESTYGNNSHGDIAAVEPQLLEAVKHVCQTRGRLIIPAFAVGRTQTMLWYFEKFIREKAIPPLPIFVDSPMGVEATKVTRAFHDYFDPQTIDLMGETPLFGGGRVTLASTRQESMQINAASGPCIIIASSPTCEFGRVLHHIKRSVEEPKDLIVFVGWTPHNTLGRRLQAGQKRVRIYDRWYDLRCQVRTIHGLSAHADGDELLKFLAPTIRQQTQAFIVHGEPDQAEGFAQRLLEAGMGSAIVPALETSVVVFGGTKREGQQEPRIADAE